MHKEKKWLTGVLIMLIAALAAIMGLVIAVDPYFHYHAPLGQRQYTLNNERYQNNGIVKHFQYDAIITGSSMTENFKTSEFDALFGVHSIKVPFAGGSLKEAGDNLRVAFESNPNIRLVLRSIDYDALWEDKDAINYDEKSYPKYLYDDNPLNDVSYIFNTEVIMAAVQNLIGIDADGPIEMSFDKYAAWNRTLGLNAIKYNYHRDAVTRAESEALFTDEERETITGNLNQNLISIAREHPDCQFVVFISPNSICSMDYAKLEGRLKKQFEAERFITEKLMAEENIRVFSFFDQTDLITNTDNYCDVAHYSPAVSSQLMAWMAQGVGEKTPDNIDSYFEAEYDYYMNYDYDSIYQ